MDFTRFFEFILRIITKQQIIDFLARINITGYTDFHVFLVWLFTSIIVDIILLVGVYMVVSWSVKKALGGIEL